MKYILSVFSLLVIMTIMCCNDEEPVKKGEVSFILDRNKILNSLGNVQKIVDEADIKAVRISVNNDRGKKVITNKILELSSFEGNYSTEPVKLKVGSYELTQFEIIDATGAITFETPNEEADNASLVDDPLAIDFVVPNDSISVVPDVVSTTESIGFQIQVSSFNTATQVFESTPADVSIVSGTELLTDYTLPVGASQVDVEKNDLYTVAITKTGYAPFTRNFTLSEIQAYAVQSLKIRLYTESTLNNLLVYYPFSGNANDESGHSHHGTVDGATLNADFLGNFNSSYRFDGVNDLINFGNILDELNYPFTISAWIKRENPSTPPYNTFFSSQEGPTDVYNGFDVTVNGPSHHGITLGDGRGQNNSAFRKSMVAYAETDKNNAWNHFSAVVNSNNDIKIYIDGVYVSGSYSGESNEPMSSNYPSDVAMIGRWTSNGITYFYKGSVDELRVWQRALTQLEIKATM
jgi:Concanavalin A-like lectin/glucanases superfamily